MNKLAVVTGGTRGIGKAIALALKNSGFDVAVVYHNGVEQAKILEEIGISTFSFDVSDFEQCQNGIEKIREKFGTDVSVLVNNAGITKDKMMHKMDFQDWTAVINTNLNSVFNMSHAVISKMRDNGYGRIVNISSVNGLKGQVGQVNYSAAKAGIIGFTKALAQESAAKGITVNAIAPGYIDTDMTLAIREDIREQITKTIPVGRFGKVEEIANTVLFLVGENSSFITGATICVNGGQYLY